MARIIIAQHKWPYNYTKRLSYPRSPLVTHDRSIMCNKEEVTAMYTSLSNASDPKDDKLNRHRLQKHGPTNLSSRSHRYYNEETFAIKAISIDDILFPEAMGAKKFTCV